MFSQEGGLLDLLYLGVKLGIYPPLIFLGRWRDDGLRAAYCKPEEPSSGAAAQLGIFVAFFGAMFLGFNLGESASIGIIGGADGPTAIYTASKLARSFWTDSCCGIFLYGTCAHNTAAYNESADD